MTTLFLRIICVFFICLAASGTHAAEEKSGNPKVIMKTELGDITIELFEKEAPITVKNFLTYIDKRFYDGTVFHRVIPGFVVQGGGFRFDLTRKETLPAITNESSTKLKNLKGTLSMARLNNPDSATSQFFINLVDNPSLDKNAGSAGYAVFGKVIQGFEVVKKLEKEPQGLFKSNPTFSNMPNIKPRIIKITR